MQELIMTSVLPWLLMAVLYNIYVLDSMKMVFVMMINYDDDVCSHGGDMMIMAMMKMMLAMMTVMTMMLTMMIVISVMMMIW